MRTWFRRVQGRRRPIREQRARTAGVGRAEWWHHLLTWPVLIAVSFVIAVCLVGLAGGSTVDYAVGQRLDSPIYAKVDFEVPDQEKTEQAREAARASTPSYYTLNSTAITFDRIRADLRRVFRAAASADTHESFQTALKEMGIEADQAAYERLRRLVDKPENAGRDEFHAWIDQLPLERQYVVRGLVQEPREPASTTDFIVLVAPDANGVQQSRRIQHTELVPQGREMALRGSANELSRIFPFDLRPLVEVVVLKVLRDQPTIVYNQQRTEEAMRAAEEATSVVTTTHLKGRPFVQPGVLGSQAFELILAHRAAFNAFLDQDSEEAGQLRRELFLQRAGLTTLVGVLAIVLMVYAGVYQMRLYESAMRMAIFASIILGTFVASRIVDLRWPDAPQAILGVCLLTAAVIAIAYEQRFAIGVMCITALLVGVGVSADVGLLLTLFTGVTACAYQLHEIRTRTKLITTGAVTALAVMLVSAAAGFAAGASAELVWNLTWSAGAAALVSALIVSGALPFIERTFGIATALTLLEWRDPTKKLLQLLAREAPGTYTHSLTLGTLAEAACDRIGANGLLAQVGALYHDIGKIPKADYFTENQGGGTNRHDKLAPTMSLLIILGHVKDGLEMAREYKLPSVLRQFIAEHHGTTVVRYFHHVASEKHAQIATGRHDREVSEAEFRYPGPKPRLRESAVLMLCDSIEGAVRSLSEPTPGRIESLVHQIVSDRLNDGQFDDCDITLREVRLVEESLVKSLCSIYHGRVSYPKAKKPKETAGEPARMSV